MARLLPRTTTRMVGRTGELARLTELLERNRVAVISGMAGVGKSTLALAYAELWAGPACWVSVAGAPSIAALTSEAFRQLGVAHYDLDASDAARLADLAALLDRERALVVLDDLHALPPESRAMILAEAMRGLRRGRLIATSRELISVPGARDLHVGLEPLDRTAAAELCAGLVALFGPGLDFEAAWGVARGNPFLLRQAHIGTVRDHNPLDETCASLAGSERVLAVALALAAAPLPLEVMTRLAAPGAADELGRRLIAERTADGYAMHDLIREALLRTVAISEQAEVRDRLIEAIDQPAPPFGGAAARGHAPVVDQPAPPFGGAAARGHAPVVDHARTGDVIRHVPELARLLRAAGRFAELAALLSDTGVALVRAGADAFVLRELEALPLEVMTARLRLLHARTLCHGLQFGRAYELLTAMAATPDASVASALLLGNVATWAGALDHAEATLGALTDPAHEPSTRARAALGLAWVRINRGTWRDVGERAPVLYAESLRLCDALLRDQLDVGVAAARAVLDHAGPAPREPWARLLFPILLAPMLARAGELTQAERVVAWADAAFGHERDRAEIQIARAIIAIEAGDRIDQLAVLRSSIRLFDRGSFFAGSAWVRTALGRVLYQLGRRREAATVLDPLRASGTIAYLPGIDVAERQDPLHADWLTTITAPPPAAKRGDAIRDQVRAALRAVAEGRLDEPAPIDIPDALDFALDRVCLAVARAVIARRHGQRRVAAQQLQRAASEASAGGVDAELVTLLHDALDTPAAPLAALVVDRERHELIYGARRISLATRPAVRAVLYAFADAADGYLSHDDLAQALWQAPYDPERHASTLKSTVRRLRVLLGDLDLDLDILPEPGGYRRAPRLRS